MKLRIVSDGTTYGTKVLDERGERIEGVTWISWRIEAGGHAEAILQIKGMPIDALGEER